MRLTFTILGWTTTLTTEPATLDDDDTVQAIAGSPSADLTVAPHEPATTYEPEERIGFH